MKKIFTLAITLSLAPVAQAKIVADHDIYQAKSYQEITQFMQKNDLFSKNTLVVLDDDGTLTMLPCSPKKNQCQYIGSLTWEQWQAELASHPQKIKPIPAEHIYAISKLVKLISQASLVEPKAEGHFLNILKNNHTTTMVATARSAEANGTTESQLNELGLSNLFRQQGLIINHIRSAPYPWMLANLNRPTRYEEGVLYLTGQKKGVAVKDMLQKTQQKFKNIVFIDDTLKNATEFKSTFKNTPYKVYSIHYTFLAKHKKYLSQNKKQQQKTQKNLVAFLNNIKKAIIKPSSAFTNTS